MRIGLVGCVKSKLDTAAPAQDLYTSPLFLRRREWVERTCDRWFILSALHGLVEPDQELKPYDLALSDVGRAERREWSEGVTRALDAAVGPLDDHVFELHAGDAYVDFGLAEGLEKRGATIERPMSGLTLGQQLAAYGGIGVERHPPPVNRQTPRRVATPTPRRTGGKYSPLAAALESSTAAAITLSFHEIERILGFALPASAHKYGAWWQNDDSSGHSHARAWLSAGRVARVNLSREIVTFSRYGVDA